MLFIPGAAVVKECVAITLTINPIEITAGMAMSGEVVPTLMIASGIFVLQLYDVAPATGAIE